MNEENREDRAAFNILKGEIELAKGNHDKAVELFETAYTLKSDNYTLESLAQGYLMSHDLEQAIQKYEELVSEKSLGWEAQECWIQAHYLLGKIFEEKGDVEKAIQYFQRFFDIWKDADPDIPILIEAKKRLAKLKGATEK
jgi:tetratricopeptide (TPR) repeat protein